MSRHAVRYLLACSVACAVPGVASAQAQRGDTTTAYAGVSIGALVTTSTVSRPLAFPVYGESARVAIEGSWPAGPTVEIDGGIRLWREVGVVVTVSHGRRDAGSSVSGTIPHPYFFGQPRTLEATGPSLARTETAVHLGLMWRRRVTRRITVAAIAGPSVMAVGQDMVGAVVLSETYPYTAVQLSHATVARRDASGVGVHAAGDVVVAIARHLGVTAGSRYSRATVTVRSEADQPADIDLGGVVVRAGVRWLF